LANTACLDDAQCAAVRGFVERGGGLVASLDASLCNEYGDARADFALADVLGVHHRGVPTVGAVGTDLDVNFARNLGPEYWEKRKTVWDLKRVPGNLLDSPKLIELIGNDIVNFKGQAVKVAADADTQTLATLDPKPEAKGDIVPAIVTHTFGKGRVVYLAA